MSLFRGYVGAKSCTSGPQPGVGAFMRAALVAVPVSRSDGIYNCRDVRGSTTTTSLHGEGRAFDWGCRAGASWARRAADLLVDDSAQLGIQCVIYDRRIWSGKYPTKGWRPYDGLDSHTTHLHIEFSWAAAKALTQPQAAHYLQQLIPEVDPMATMTPEQIGAAVANAIMTTIVARGPEGTVTFATAAARSASELMRITDMIADSAEHADAIARGDAAGQAKALARIRARDIAHPGEHK